MAIIAVQSLRLACRVRRILKVKRGRGSTSQGLRNCCTLTFLKRHFGVVPMNFSQMKDERLLLFYEAIRQQVISDGNNRYRLAGDGVRAYADKLREEMDRRRLSFTSIDCQAYDDGCPVRSPQSGARTGRDRR